MVGPPTNKVHPDVRLSNALGKLKTSNKVKENLLDAFNDWKANDRALGKLEKRITLIEKCYVQAADFKHTNEKLFAIEDCFLSKEAIIKIIRNEIRNELTWLLKVIALGAGGFIAIATFLITYFK